MFDPLYLVTTQQYSNDGCLESRAEKVLTSGRLLISSEPVPVDDSYIIAVASQLINLYDMPYNARSSRDEAAEIVTELAMHYSSVLDLVIQNTAAYSNGQCIDDADPYYPNSYSVLSRVGRSSERVVRFLERTVREESGLLRSHSLATLCALQA